MHFVSLRLTGRAFIAHQLPIKTFKMKKVFFLLLLCNSIFIFTAHAQYGSFDYAKPVKPFKIFDNLYYVGNDAVSAYLLVTDKGIILIDALYAKYTADIPVSIKDLGFNIKDIKYIICSHGHFDHCEGAPAMQQLTGARIGMTAPDWDMAEWKTKDSYASVNVKLTRDWVIKDGDSLVMGNTTIHFYETPGHTLGVLSMAFPVRDGSQTYKAFMFGGVGLNFTGVPRAETYLHSVDRVMQIKGIQVNISNHPDPGHIFDKAKLLAARKPGEPNPFVAPDEFQAWLADLKKAGEQKLAEEKKKAGE
jgi:metallo-beta-lactamase class B